MFNPYNIRTIKVDGVVFTYFLQYSSNDKTHIHCCAGEKNITAYFKAIVSDEELNVADEIRLAMKALKSEDPELYKEVISAKSDPLMVKYDLCLHNDDVSTVDYILALLELLVPENTPQQNNAIVETIHYSDPLDAVQIKKYCSYEHAHAACVYISSLNAQTDNTTKYSVTPDLNSCKNFKTLYDHLQERELI